MKWFLSLCCLLLCSGSCLLAQPAAHEEGPWLKKSALIGIPLLFYSPETRLGGGGGAVFAFRFRGEDSLTRASQLQVLAAYTQEDQILAYLPFRLFWENERHTLYGEIGYYRYTYFFWGIGNQLPASNREQFDVRFPRLRLHYQYEWLPDLYFGPFYYYDGYQVTGKAAGGLLDDPSRDLTGRNGGRISGPGLIATFDRRDNLFFPAKGSFVEATVQLNAPATGSDFRYLRYTLDAAFYLPTWREQVLALNAYGEFIHGDPPFNALALLGGGRRLRGYYEGRFRDKRYLAVQAEYRAPLFWRIGLNAFLAYGGVAPTYQAFRLDRFRYTFGGGLRLRVDRAERINLRIDAGFGQDTQGFYLTIGEAF